MTYLQLINAVMRRLREEQVTTVDETDYSRLIGDYVNDAKRQVEDAWDWSSLRHDFTVSAVAGTSTYSLTGSGGRSEIIEVYNETDNYVLSQLSLSQIDRYKMATDDTEGSIMSYSVSGLDSNGDMIIKLHATPDENKTLTVKAIKRTGDLAVDSDTTSAPSAPIIQYAYSFALRERGETGGQTASEQAAFAKQDLNNAIALDAAMRPEETIWTTV